MTTLLVDVDHGLSCYYAGCRCETGRKANAQRKAAQAKRRYLGLASENDLVAPDQARAWVTYLQSQGMSYKTIEAASGVTRTSLALICTGKSRHPGNPPGRITRATE